MKSDDIIKQYENKFGASIEVLLEIPKKYDEYQYRAKSKNIPFNLSFGEFDYLCKQPCFYCNHLDKTKPTGIDRMDNNKGYDCYNVAPCCWTCNRAKSDMSFKEFKKYLKRFKYFKE